MNIFKKLFGPRSKYDNSLPYTYMAKIMEIEGDEEVTSNYFADTICGLIDYLVQNELKPEQVALFGVYLKKEIPLEKVDLIFQILKNGEIFELVDLNLDAWEIFHSLNVPELHDRMIIATFYYYKARGLITNDPEIPKSIPVIWK